jgi:hypothetical protein
MMRKNMAPKAETPRLEFIGDFVDLDHLEKAAAVLNNGNGEAGQVRVVIDHDRSDSDETLEKPDKHLYVEAPEELHPAFVSALDVIKNAPSKSRKRK